MVINDCFCCNDMKMHVYIVNEDIVIDNGKVNSKPIYYSSNFNEYGIALSNSNSYIIIDYCPWCGKKLPDSLRDKWFEELEKLGYENPIEEDIPIEYKTSKWYR